MIDNYGDFLVFIFDRNFRDWRPFFHLCSDVCVSGDCVQNGGLVAEKVYMRNNDDGNMSGFYAFLAVLALVFWAMGFITGILTDRCWSGSGKYTGPAPGVPTATVACQAPTTYTGIAGANTPRFRPLAEHAWG